MLIATFKAHTAWAGRRIVREDDAFVLEGFGAISALDVITYGRLGLLAWDDADVRAWVEEMVPREALPIPEPRGGHLLSSLDGSSLRSAQRCVVR